jgi:hypothetical protein
MQISTGHTVEDRSHSSKNPTKQSNNLLNTRTRQFAERVAFTVTINKSQGHTFEYVKFILKCSFIFIRALHTPPPLCLHGML